MNRKERRVEARTGKRRCRAVLVTRLDDWRDQRFESPSHRDADRMAGEIFNTLNGIGDIFGVR
jgi:hypothetical protein